MRTFLIGLLSCVVFIILFQHPIFSKIATLYCNHLSHVYLKGDFAYENVGYEEGYLTFHKVQVFDWESKKVRLSAEHLKIKYDFAFDHLDLDIHLNEPVLNFFGTKHALTKLPRFPHPFFKILGHLTISDGSLAYVDEKSVFFDFDGEYRSQVPMHLQLGVGFSPKDPQIQITGQSDSRGGKHFNCLFNHANCPHLSLLLKQIFPPLDPFEFTQGLIDGSLNFYLLKGNNSYVQGLLQGEEVRVLQGKYEGYAPLISIRLDRGESQESVDFDHLLVKMLVNSQGSLRIDQGVVFKDLNKILDLKGELTLPNAKVEVNGIGFHQEKQLPFQMKGTFEPFKKHYRLQANVESISGWSEVDLASPSLLAKIELQGNVKDLSNLLAIKIQEPNKLSDFKLSAELKPTNGGNEVEGALFLKGQEMPLRFGFELKDSIPSLNSSDSFEIIKAAFPERSFKSPFASTLKILCFHIAGGWFKATDFDLFAFFNPSIKALGNFYGQLNSQSLLLSYFANEFSFENENIRASLGSPFALHYVDLESGSSCGFLPFQKGMLHFKKENILFEDIQSCAFIDDSQISMANVESFSKGIFFGGSVDIAFNPLKRGAYDVLIQSDTISGKVSQIQEFLKPFAPPSWILAFPLEGEVSFRKKGAMLRFAVNPNAYTLDAKIQGSIAQGKIDWGIDSVRLQDFALNFDYDNQAKSLIFSDIEGLVLAGPHEHYEFVGDYVNFIDYTKNDTRFDIWVSDKNRDIVRIVGQSALEGEKNIKFTFDRDLTHFGDVRPQIFDLTLSDWGQVEGLDFRFSFHPKSLLPDLQKLTPLIYPLKVLAHLKITDGEGQFDLHYDPLGTAFEYELKCQNATWNKQQFDTFLLLGKKMGSSWSIDQLQLDQYSLAADISFKEDRWYLNFLGISVKDTLMAGLEGIYQKEGAFLGKVNLLEVEIANLSKWKPLQEFFKDLQPKGKLNAVGAFRIQPPVDGKNWRYETTLLAGIKDFYLKEMPLNDFEAFTCHLTSDRGITLDHIKGSQKLAVEKIDFDFINHKLGVHNLLFSIPAQDLIGTIKNLKRFFPTYISSRTSEIVQNIKNEGNIKGKLDLEYDPSHASIQLELEPGTYIFYDREIDLKTLCFRSDPYEWKLLTQSSNALHPYWMLARSSGPHFDRGEITISENFPEAKGDRINLLWKDTPEEGFQIEHIKGSLPGITVDIISTSSKPDLIHLKGTTSIQLDKIPFFFPDQLDEMFKSCGFKGHFTLNGEWTYRKTDALNSVQGLYFTGALQGQELIFRDFLFRSCTANIEFSPQNMLLRNVRGTDSSGKLEIAEMQLTRHANDVVLHIPSMRISQFRPCLLRNSQGLLSAPATPLFIKQLEVENLEGSLVHSNKIGGKGKLVFANPKKQKLFDTTSFEKKFSKIGLDPALLTPVSGSIYYTIEDGKILLTKFKDLYSAGKLSKFTLQNMPYQSYMDFDGNLHVHVKMKQYNLLFKLAEMFTMTIQGTLQSPTYTLQKQSQTNSK